MFKDPFYQSFPFISQFINEVVSISDNIIIPSIPTLKRIIVTMIRVVIYMSLLVVKPFIIKCSDEIRMN